MRIALIHATPIAIEPIRAAFTQLWPEARVTHLLEDSLAPDLVAAGRIDGEICAIMGFLGEVKRRLYALHREGTDMADAHGVDIPQPRGGGGR